MSKALRISGLLFCLFPALPFASDRSHYDEPGLTPGREYLDQHFAERIDPFSGNLQLQYVDLFLPGNAGFDLRVRRSYNSNALAMPLSPFGQGWDIHFGRVKRAPGSFCANAAAQSMALQLPDGSSQTLHKSNGVASTSTSSDYLTTAFWKGQCDASGGLIVLSPDGTRYEMTEVDTGYWHAARIVDRFGNTMNITYVTNLATGHRVISEVNASDGRRVIFSYSGGRLQSIAGGGVTWNYTVSTGPENSNQLTTVDPPAGGNSQYAYNGNLGAAAGSFALRQVTSPFGGIVQYTYGHVNFLPGVIGWAPASAITSKRAGSDVWSYAYQPSCPGSSHDTTTVTQPDGIGRIVYRHFGYCTVSAGDVWKIGLLYQKSTGSLQTETLSWTPQAISNESVVRPGYGKFDINVFRPLMSQRVVTRDGLAHTTTYSGFDLSGYGNPSSIAESGNRSRSKSLTYFNSASLWIVGLVNNETISGVGTISRTRGTLGQLLSESRYGVTTSFGYHGDGSVSSKSTPTATTTFNAYMRGIPESEHRPAGVTINRQVDNRGNVTSQSDGDFSWGYSYDGLGRLTAINFPAGSDATISWTTSSKSLARGGYNEVSQLDSFGRVTSTTRESVTQTFRYDALGRKTFESMPGSTQGTDFTYDALGRVSQMQSPAGTRDVNYPAGAMTVTDERGSTTRFDYDRYGDPDENHLNAITPAVSSAAVTMDRNTIGILLSATQNGVTRHYKRDGRFFVTSMQEPEVGTTSFGRDGVGNMTSRTLGGQTTNYSYDGLNRMTSVTAPGISATLGYNNRGKVTSVVNSAASRTFAYDANGNLTQDSLTVDGQTFAVAYGYDGIDGLHSITYPMGKGTVTYTPDNLGRPTRALPYLNSVSHHPSGNLSSISFANGITQTHGENARQLPSSINASTILGLTYSYDPAGNVTAITDTYSPAESRNLGYDDIDRLTTANGPWGSGAIQYDGAGNITRQQFGSYAINSAYSSNRLTSTWGSVVRNLTYDGRGNITGNGQSTFTFDSLSQLACVSCGTGNEIGYKYDAQGRRVSQEVGGSKTYFVQAPNGDLQFEYTPFGQRWTKHVYLHGKRVATESGSTAPVTSLNFSATPGTVSFGQTLTLSASITPAAATGSARFLEGAVVLGSNPFVSGTATRTVSNLTVGPHTLKAEYLGDANHQPSTSASVTVQVNAVVPSAPQSATVVGGATTATISFNPPVSTGGIPLTSYTAICMPGAISVTGPSSPLTVTGLALGVAHSCSVTARNAIGVGPASNSVSVSIGLPADLAVSQSVASSAATGRDVIYTLTVANYGPNAAANVVLTNAAPAGASIIWASPGCSVGSALTCNVGTLTPSATMQFKMVLRPTVAGTLTNVANVTGEVNDSVPANNTSTSSVAVSASTPGVPITRYRLYCLVNQDRLFTTDVNEYNTLASYTGTWQAEGAAGNVLNNPGSFNGVTAVPYYRLYNGATQWHHWTTDANEYYTLIEFPNWVGEGTDGFILPNNTAGAIKLYRLNYPALPGYHHWTVDANEYNVLIASYGWVGEASNEYLIQ